FGDGDSGLPIWHHCASALVRCDPNRFGQPSGLSTFAWNGTRHASPFGPHERDSSSRSQPSEAEMEGKVLHLRPRGRSGSPPLSPAGTTGELSPYTARQLLARKPVKRRWIWDRYLPEGTLAILSAYMRVGKTSFIYPLALAVARGKPFLGYKTAGVGVL